MGTDAPPARASSPAPTANSADTRTMTTTTIHRRTRSGLEGGVCDGTVWDTAKLILPVGTALPNWRVTVPLRLAPQDASQTVPAQDRSTGRVTGRIAVRQSSRPAFCQVTANLYFDASRCRRRCCRRTSRSAEPCTPSRTQQLSTSVMPSGELAAEAPPEPSATQGDGWVATLRAPGSADVRAR